MGDLFFPSPVASPICHQGIYIITGHLGFLDKLTSGMLCLAFDIQWYWFVDRRGVLQFHELCSKTPR